MHKTFNRLNPTQIDPTQIKDLKYTDRIFTTEGVIEVIEKTKLVEINNIVITN